MHGAMSRSGAWLAADAVPRGVGTDVHKCVSRCPTLPCSWTVKALSDVANVPLTTNPAPTPTNLGSGSAPGSATFPRSEPWAPHASELAAWNDTNPTPSSPPAPEDLVPVESLRAVLDRPFSEAREQWIEAFERAYLRNVLARHSRNVAAAAVTAGVDRTYVYRLMRRHGI